jgi:hypothetical protein
VSGDNHGDSHGYSYGESHFSLLEIAIKEIMMHERFLIMRRKGLLSGMVL